MRTLGLFRSSRPFVGAISAPNLRNNLPPNRLMSSVQKFQTIAVLDRCVPAMKIILSAKKQNSKTVLFVTEAELNHVAADLADHVIVVSSLYNYEEAITKLSNFLKEKGIENAAIDPGWGVRSESAELSGACAPFIFVGPPPETMTLLGDKWESNNLAQKLGVEVIPGYYGEKQDIDTLLEEADKLGYDGEGIMVKGPGGGGSGNRKVKNRDECKIALENIRHQNPKAKIILQKILVDLVHREVQVIADSTGAYILGARECSKQTKRGQKNFEESLAELPLEIEKSALILAKKAQKLGYRGVMTIEFFNKFFGEVNPRLQVEHALTEWILGKLDLVALRHWVAAGGTVKDFLIKACGLPPLSKDETVEEMILILQRASSAKYTIQARVHAELCEAKDGVFTVSPVKGHVTQLKLPEKNVFCGVKEGSYVDTSECSQIIALLIGVGDSPELARQDLLNRVLEMQVGGIPTNLEYLKASLEFWIKNPNLEIHTGTCRKFENHFVQLHLMHPELFSRKNAESSAQFFQPKNFDENIKNFGDEDFYKSLGRD